MKLYQLNRGDKFTIEHSDVIVFDHIDGMYSYCWFENETSFILHIAAGTEVNLVIDYPQQLPL